MTTLDPKALEAARDEFERTTGEVTSLLALRHALTAYLDAISPSPSGVEAGERVAWRRDLIERLAKAIYMSFVDKHGYPNGLPTWDELPLAYPDTDLGSHPDGQEGWRDAARVALDIISSPPAVDAPKVQAEWKMVPVEPTEEMVEAAAMFEDDKEPSGWGKMVPITYAETWAAMLAASPAQPSATEGVRVKKLEFENYGNGLFIADTMFGRYRVDEVLGQPGVFKASGPHGFSVRDLGSDDEGKAAVQADYEARILAALEGSGT